MMREILRSLSRQKRTAQVDRKVQRSPMFAPLQNATDLAVIGDVHGMLRPFDQMLTRLAQHAPTAQVVCVGDLIDRGDQSAEVLRLAFEHRANLIVLLGNHEEMLLRFLDDPASEAERWLRNGGLQALASFAIAPLGVSATALEHNSVRDRLRAALTPEIEGWLRGLPRSYANGNITVTHAGCDPWLPMSEQTNQALTWGHPDFGRRRRTDGTWVAHGHVIVPEVRCADGILSVDTGAYAGGCLSCAIIAAGEVQVLNEFS